MYRAINIEFIEAAWLFAWLDDELLLGFVRALELGNWGCAADLLTIGLGLGDGFKLAEVFAIVLLISLTDFTRIGDGAAVCCCNCCIGGFGFVVTIPFSKFFL